MKARKPDGTRWFTPTAAEVMDRWLAELELLDWLQRTAGVWDLQAKDGAPEATLIAALIDAWLDELVWLRGTPREQQEAHELLQSDWLHNGSGRPS